MEQALSSQLGSVEATELDRMIRSDLSELRGVSIRLGRLLWKFDQGQGWKTLSPKDDDGNPYFTSLWEFYKAKAPEWGLTAKYLYEIRDQGRAQDQQNLMGWSGASLRHVAKLNDDVEQQTAVVEAIRKDHGNKPVPAKEVKVYVDEVMPPKKKEKPKSVRELRKEEAATEQDCGKFKAIVGDLQWCLDMMLPFQGNPKYRFNASPAVTAIQEAIAHVRKLQEKSHEA